MDRVFVFPVELTMRKPRGFVIDVVMRHADLKLAQALSHKRQILAAGGQKIGVSNVLAAQSLTANIAFQARFAGVRCFNAVFAMSDGRPQSP